MNLSATFTDPDTGQTHTCAINWDDGAVTNPAVNETAKTCSQTHTYTSAGVYTINVTICDNAGGCGSAQVWVVVYDPSAGFVTGGGWVNVAPGSYPADPSLSGRANFGFNSKYKNGGGPPTGETEFNFTVGNFNFRSASYQWLVVSGFKAQYKGTGSVNGVSGYEFRLTAYDGQLQGGGGIDKFRIRITRNGQVVFDNRMGVPEDVDVADPQAIAGGSIVRQHRHSQSLILDWVQGRGPAVPAFARERLQDGLRGSGVDARVAPVPAAPHDAGESKMATAVVGREEELRVLEELLGTHAPAQGPTAIALEGEAGIGKSTLWREAVEEARGRGLRVLTARPAETERNFAHAGLGDLLDELLPEVLPALAPPQRRALEVTLLVADNGGAPIDPRTLGVAVRSTLQALAEDGLVLAIDDLQWLDAPSARALAFAVRRLPEARVLLLWTRRLDGQRTPSPLEEALDPDHVHVVPLGSLSVGAVHRIIVSRYGKPVPRPTLLRLHEVSGGNPFYALELARALDSEDGRRDPTQPLPVPERLEELLAARLRTFTSATHDALVLAATDARLTPTQLRAAGIEPAALDPALVEGIVELADGIVRFTHPLLASVLYQALAPGERRQAHRRLAEVADEPLARARHLALSADEPDGELAAELERAASAAADHGTPIVAAELGEHALRLTPPNDRHGADRRAAATARAHLAAGEPVRARALAAELLARASPGAERARALVLTADVEADIQRTIALLQQALEEAEGEPALQAEIHGKLCLPIRFTSGLSVAERHARAALALANDDALRASARGSLALIRFNSGKPGSLRLAEEAYELASALGNAELAVDAAFALAHVLFWSYELNRARALLEHLDAVWSDRNERLSASALWYLALVEVRAGRLALASEYAQRSRAIVQQYGREEDESPQDLFPLMLVAAHRGELDRAQELTLVSLQRADRHAARLRAPHANAGFVELWRGDAAAAVERFADAEQVVGAGDGGDPGMTWWRAEQIEALLALGRVDDAVERLDAWEADARRLRRRWVVAHATRCRGLVASARGDLDGALSLLADAASQHEAVGDPFGRGRALLALGVVRRRAKQKRASREALEAAAAAFDDMGAAGWAARARAELGSIGGRTRTDGLTKSERRVADLVAQGRTNAEVAAALYLAERTVASHLTHIYAKLGIRSRTELARKLG